MGTGQELWAVALGISLALLEPQFPYLFKGSPAAAAAPPPHTHTSCFGQRRKLSPRERKGRPAAPWGSMLHPNLLFLLLPPHPSAHHPTLPRAISRHSLLPQAHVLGNDPDNHGPTLEGRRQPSPQTVTALGDRALSLAWALQRSSGASDI